MMTVLELLNALDNGKGDYDAPVVITLGGQRMRILSVDHVPEAPEDRELGVCEIEVG